MKRLTFLLMMFSCSVCAVAQANPAPVQSAAKYGPSAIWTATPDFLKSAHAACDNRDAGKLASCFIEQMTQAGASADAVSFTHALYDETRQFGVMGAIRPYPPVDLAWVVFPLRANHNDALLIVNGKPPFIDLDDTHKLDQAAMEKDPLFQQWKATSPQVAVFPADHSAGAPLVEYARVWPGPKPGDIQFVVSYRLLNGCQTCAGVGFVNYLWNFDGAGNFLGTKFLSVTRGMPPLKRSFHPSQPPDQPAPPTK